ncbi:MAG: glycosyltransferase [Candidatus Humimicrobiaceae bacterium]
MNIAIFSDTFYPRIDGIVITLLNSIQLLAEKGHKIKLYVPNYKNIKIREFHKNISIERHGSFKLIGYPNFRLAMPVPPKVTKSILSFKPDIIHVHTPGSLGIIGIICAKKYKIPLIGTYHAYLTAFLVCISPNKKINKSDKKHLSSKIIWRLSNYFYDKCDLVIVPSESMKKEIKKSGLKAEVIFLSNGLNLDKFSQKKKYNNEAKLLHVGRISFEKNIDIIIKSVGILSMEFPDIKLDIVGDGPALKNLELMTKKFDLEKNIHFLGFIDNNKLNEIYKEHDIFITASAIETQGIVILEAMASGLPIVGVNKSAIPDYVKNNVNGYTVEPFNAREMSEKIKTLYINRKLREDFGKKSAELVKEHDVNDVINKLESLYFEYADTLYKEYIYLPVG